jgi:hypothetical protein
MKFESKFNVKDRLWYMKDNKPTEVIISSLNIRYSGSGQDYIKYTAHDVIDPVSWIDHQHLFEETLYKSKAELLESL